MCTLLYVGHSNGSYFEPLFRASDILGLCKSIDNGRERFFVWKYRHGLHGFKPTNSSDWICCKCVPAQ